MAIKQCAFCVSRGMALFFGGFAALNVVGGLVSSGFDANLWWIDIRPLPDALAAVWMAVSAAAMLAFAARPRMSLARRWASLLVICPLIAVAFGNAWTVLRLDAAGRIDAAFALPFSIFVAFMLVLVVTGVFMHRCAVDRWRTRVGVIAIALICALAFPFGQMFCFGKTDYRRGADAAVVFGCLARADGTPSLPLGDRVRTAVELYDDGVVDILIFSGGPGAGQYHETEVMRDYAMQMGVPAQAIMLDREGLSTRHTVNNTVPLFDEYEFDDIIAVSNFYHLPRIKLTYQRAGVDVFTVPAKDSRTMRQLPYNMMREVAALWVYYAEPLVG